MFRTLNPQLPIVDAVKSGKKRDSRIEVQDMLPKHLLMYYHCYLGNNHGNNHNRIDLSHLGMSQLFKSKDPSWITKPIICFEGFLIFVCFDPVMHGFIHFALHSALIQLLERPQLRTNVVH